MRLNIINLDVNCEGFEHPYDPYILLGSCGASYSLKDDTLHPQSRRHPVTTFATLIIVIIGFTTIFASCGGGLGTAVAAGAGYLAGRSRRRRPWANRARFGNYTTSRRRTTKAFSGTTRR